ncbi:Protein YaiI [Enterobacter cloacae]|uniref:Protein YaiI n=1 Tax=Enterobacter cloacae TaxID=550 RepID=A0A377M5C7_ENTCL|nr:Protein YaiI [Enterobacter cloacae]
MAIWVDADACPNVIKEILFRAAERVQMPLTLVANQNIRVPPSRFIRALRFLPVLMWRITRSYGCAARKILVITADIPLAAEVLKRRRSAEPARGALLTSNHPGKTDHARFHGYASRQRCADRRAR